jgi:hypothetical protein
LGAQLHEFADAVNDRWKKAYDWSYRHGAKVARNAAFVTIDWTEPILDRVRDVFARAQVLLEVFSKNLESANRFAQTPLTVDSLWTQEYLNYCLIQEIAKLVPTVVHSVGPVQNVYLSDDLLSNSPKSILITGAAGFGKTSFCKWNAVADLNALAEKTSDVLPIYVPLHRLATRKLGSYKQEFFSTTELNALTSPPEHSNDRRVQRMRIYLDGLDEVSRIDRQCEIVELARKAVNDDPRIQIVLTGRDYVSGVWLNWIPRVHISELSHPQIKKLVYNLLGRDRNSEGHFFAELSKVPSLESLMQVPLLGTLIVSVHKNGKMTTLPENRIRLYEMFIELMSGGWDLVKNVRRQTHFGSEPKVAVLIRLAGHMHLNRIRQCKETDIKLAVRATSKDLETKWRLLRDELLQDGLLTRSGNSYAFSHLSFQEYLAAKDLNDPSGRKQQLVVRTYLGGDDWWAQVLSFYISILGKPDEADHWVCKNINELLKRGTIADDAATRYDFLLDCITENAPSYAPRNANRLDDFSSF